jgi:1,4-dihydroxy-2-naphthoate octaprenyltransferase
MMNPRINFYVKALRLYTFPAPLAPVLVCAALVQKTSPPLNLAAVILLLAGVCALFFGTNLVNDYYDYKKGVDTAASMGTSGVLVHGLLKPAQVRAGFIALYGLACLIGMYFIALRGLPLLLLLAAGMGGGYLYTGGPYALKYHGLGELLVFCLMGPLLFTALQYALTGAYSPDNFLLSIPFGLLCAAVLAANNLRDQAEDARAGIRTIATMLGFAKARLVFSLLIFVPFVLVGLLVWQTWFPPGLLLSLGALPAAIIAAAPLWEKRPEGRLKNPVPAAFGLQLFFGLLTFIGILW